MADRIHRYVVGLDRSELGLLAVDEALRTAVERGGELHVVFVYQPLGDATNLYAGPADPAMAGPAAEALIATAAVLAADAIFVGTHGRTGLRRAFLGSELRWPTHHRQIAIR